MLQTKKLKKSCGNVVKVHLLCRAINLYLEGWHLVLALFGSIINGCKLLKIFERVLMSNSNEPVKVVCLSKVSQSIDT